MQVTAASKPLTYEERQSRAIKQTWLVTRTKRARVRGITRAANDPDRRLTRFLGTLVKELEAQLRLARRRGDPSRAKWLQPALDGLTMTRRVIVENVAVPDAG